MRKKLRLYRLYTPFFHLNAASESNALNISTFRVTCFKLRKNNIYPFRQEQKQKKLLCFIASFKMRPRLLFFLILYSKVSCQKPNCPINQKPIYRIQTKIHRYILYKTMNIWTFLENLLHLLRFYTNGRNY